MVIKDAGIGAHPPIDAFYSIYLTGAQARGFAMVALRKGKVIGSDALGATIAGSYDRDLAAGYRLRLTVTLPPNLPLIQGGSTGPEGDRYELDVHLLPDFLNRFVRLETKHGPFNARFVRLASIDD